MTSFPPNQNNNQLSRISQLQYSSIQRTSNNLSAAAKSPSFPSRRSRARLRYVVPDPFSSSSSEPSPSLFFLANFFPRGLKSGFLKTSFLQRLIRIRVSHAAKRDCRGRSWSYSRFTIRTSLGRGCTKSRTSRRRVRSSSSCSRSGE